jgi:hypothetical protein
MTCDASRSPFSGPGSMSIRMLTFARNSVVIGSTVAWESSESRFERTTTAGRALSHDSRTTTTVPRRMASGSTAILPFGPRAARNPPRSHPLPASRWQADGTHRRGEPDSQDRLRPAATARPRAIRAHAGRSDGERSGRGRMRGFACVTRNASAAHLQGPSDGRCPRKECRRSRHSCEPSPPLGQAKTVPCSWPDARYPDRPVVQPRSGQCTSVSFKKDSTGIDAKAVAA